MLIECYSNYCKEETTVDQCALKNTIRLSKPRLLEAEAAEAGASEAMSTWAAELYKNEKGGMNYEKLDAA